MLLGMSLMLALAAHSQLTTESTPQERLAEAQRLQAAGNFEQARDIFERVLQSDPKNAEGLEGMSSTTERLAMDDRSAGRMDDALKDLLRAQKAEPDNFRILYDLGIQEDEMHLYADADIVLDRLSFLEPDEPSMLYMRARVKLDLGQLEAAQQNMQAYLKERPADASAHFGLGRIYLQGLQFDKAREEFERSIAIQPQQSEAYYQLGQTDLDQDKYQDAIPLFQKAIERNPQHGGALAGMGIAYFKLKQYTHAETWLSKAIQAAPDYRPGHYYLGLTLARLDKSEASHRELEIAATLAAEDNKQSSTRLRILSPESNP
jgi:tetratricopeptide (TPR) repeat protein